MNYSFSKSVGVLLFCYVILAGLIASVFPPRSIDEVNGIVGANSLLHGHAYQNSLLIDVLPAKAEPFLKNTSSVGRPLYLLWVGFFIGLFPGSWFLARFSCILAGAFLMLFVALIGKQTANSKVGILSAILLLLQPSFWLASTVVSELIITAAATAALIYFLMTRFATTEWGSLLAGFALPLLALIHPYGAVLCASVLMVIFVPRRSSTLRTRPLLLGLVAGVCVTIINEPWRLQTQNPLYVFLANPPIFSHWSFSEWTHHIFSFFRTATSFYYPGAENRVSGLSESMFVMWLTWGVVIFRSILVRSRDVWRRFLLGSLVLSTVSLILLVRRLESGYFALLLPFSIPVLAMTINAELKQRPNVMSKIILFTFSAGTLLSISAFTYFGWAYSKTYRAHDEIVYDLHAKINWDAQRVMAPSIFLFDFPKQEFRDISVLMASRYFDAGNFNPRECLEKWHPDVMVADASLVRFLRSGGNPQEILSRLLNTSVDEVGVVETGLLQGDLHIFRLTWKAAR